jgi:hypothetical protein
LARHGDAAADALPPRRVEIVGVAGKQPGRRRQNRFEAVQLALQMHEAVVEVAALRRVEAGVQGHASIMHAAH